MKEKTKKFIKNIDWMEVLGSILVWSVFVLLVVGFIWIIFFDGLQSYPGTGSSNPDDCVPNYMGGCDF